MNQQCEMYKDNSFFGISYVADKAPYYLRDICWTAPCSWRDGASIVTHQVKAIEGTKCGHRRICHQGKCTVDIKYGEDMDERCPYGDTPGAKSGIPCSEPHSRNSCYMDSAQFKTLCCETCAKRWKGFPNCEYGDRDKKSCDPKTCDAVWTWDDGNSHKDFHCCETCRRDGADMPSTTQLNLDELFPYAVSTTSSKKQEHVFRNGGEMSSSFACSCMAIIIIVCIFLCEA